MQLSDDERKIQQEITNAVENNQPVEKLEKKSFFKKFFSLFSKSKNNKEKENDLRAQMESEKILRAQITKVEEKLYDLEKQKTEWQLNAGNIPDKEFQNVLKHFEIQEIELKRLLVELESKLPWDHTFITSGLICKPYKLQGKVCPRVFETDFNEEDFNNTEDPLEKLFDDEFLKENREADPEKTKEEGK